MPDAGSSGSKHILNIKIYKKFDEFFSKVC